MISSCTTAIFVTIEHSTKTCSRGISQENMGNTIQTAMVRPSCVGLVFYMPINVLLVELLFLFSFSRETENLRLTFWYNSHYNHLVNQPQKLDYFFR